MSLLFDELWTTKKNSRQHYCQMMRLCRRISDRTPIYVDILDIIKIDRYKCRYITTNNDFPFTINNKQYPDIEISLLYWHITPSILLDFEIHCTVCVWKYLNDIQFSLVIH